MADPRECPALQAGPVSSVVEVLDRLTEIRDGTAKLAPECGIAEFSDLYRTITQGISDRIEQGDFFADNAYLTSLDVAFANRYFDALRAWAGGGRTPRTWRVLFEVPNDGEVTAIQLAGAGVNAHINFDLRWPPSTSGGRWATPRSTLAPGGRTTPRSTTSSPSRWTPCSATSSRSGRRRAWNRRA